MAAVNCEGDPGVPANAGSHWWEAVITYTPLASTTAARCCCGPPLLRNPCTAAPLKQQSSSSTFRRAAQASSCSVMNEASTAVCRSSSARVSDAT